MSTAPKPALHLEQTDDGLRIRMVLHAEMLVPLDLVSADVDTHAQEALSMFHARCTDDLKDIMNGAVPELRDWLNQQKDPAA